MTLDVETVKTALVVLPPPENMDAYAEEVTARLNAALAAAEAAPLDVERLRNAVHALRWCKASDLLHAIAHDDEDDGPRYRADFAREYAAALRSPDTEDEEDRLDNITQAGMGGPDFT